MVAASDTSMLKYLRHARLWWIIVSLLAVVLTLFAFEDLTNSSVGIFDDVVDYSMLFSFVIIFGIAVYTSINNHRALQRVMNERDVSGGWFEESYERRFCAACGHPVGADGEYCEYCGTRLRH